MKGIKELEEEYLKENTSYKIEQKFLYSYSKTDFKAFINNFIVDYNKIRIPYTIKFNKLKSSKNYFTGNELEKFFLEQVLYWFERGKEVDDKSKILEKLQTFYKLNHTNFLNQDKYKNIDINSIPINKIIGYYIGKDIVNTRKNLYCPFLGHKDKSPSFHIYKNKNIFVCFGCGKKGNAINFISYIENIDKKNAFKKFLLLIK